MIRKDANKEIFDSLFSTLVIKYPGEDSLLERMVIGTNPYDSLYELLDNIVYDIGRENASKAHPS